MALQLRALVGVHDVRDGERMQPVAFAKPADQLDVREPLHVDPDPGQPGRALLDIRKRRAMMLDHSAVIVGEQAHARRTDRQPAAAARAQIVAALPSRGGLRTRRRLRCADLAIYCCDSCCSDWGVRRATRRRLDGRIQLAEHVACFVGVDVPLGLLALEHDDVGVRGVAVDRLGGVRGQASATHVVVIPAPVVAGAPASVGRAPIHGRAFDVAVDHGEVVVALTERKLDRAVQQVILHRVRRGQVVAGKAHPIPVVLDLLLAVAVALGGGLIRRRLPAGGEHAERQQSQHQVTSAHQAHPSRITRTCNKVDRSPARRQQITAGRGAGRSGNSWALLSRSSMQVVACRKAEPMRDTFIHSWRAWPSGDRSARARPWA